MRKGRLRPMVRAMELRSFKVRAADGHVRVVTGDTDGDRGTYLFDARAATVIEVTRPLLVALSARVGAELRGLSYNGDDDALRVAPVPGTDFDPSALTIRGEGLDEHVPALKGIARAITAELRAMAGDVRGPAKESEPPTKGPDNEGPSKEGPDKDWEALYLRGFTGWELSRAAPPLASYFERSSPKGARALVVGCGRGNEARLLAELGARVTAIDIAPTAIEQAKAIASPHPIEYRVADVFALRGRPAAFDLVVEHTCFCAIDPSRRDDFVAAMADALVPGGALVGLFYAHGREGGPPFTVTEEELRERFSPAFEIEALGAARDSIITRRGDELLGRLIRR